MTIQEAYDATIEKIAEFEYSGIEVTRQPHPSRNNPEMVQKYSGTDHLKPELWLHISFHVTDRNEAYRVRQAAHYLGLAGIIFDVGGAEGLRDWELDWSFHLVDPGESELWQEAGDYVEDIINEFCDDDDL